MRKLLIAAAVALVPSAPAVAENNLGCWNTTDIEPNGSPSGSYSNNASGSVDYISPDNDGVGMLLASLDAYDNASYVICLDGSSASESGNTVWRPSSAIICPSNVFSGGACPDA